MYKLIAIERGKDRMSSNRGYKVCEECGANLDPGEKCDCKRPETDKYKILLNTDVKGQMTFDYKILKLEGII